MSSTAVQPKTNLLARILPSEYAIGRLAIFLAVLFLAGVIVFPMHLNDRLPYSIYPALPVAFFVVLGSVAMRGMAVLRWTPFDWVIMVWMILTVISQVHSVYALNRLLLELDFLSTAFSYFTFWLVYRAFYAITIVNPRVAVKSVLSVLTVLLTITCVIGILQSVGPIKQQMVDLAYRIGAGAVQIKFGASELTGVRTTSVFSGPNIFGFINLFASCLIVGWGMAARKYLKEWQAMLTVVGLGLFAYANLNSQSRSSFVLSVLLGLVYIVFLIRMQKWRALFVAGTLFVIGAVGVMLLTQSGEYDYMTKVFKTGITRDESFVVRAKGLTEFMKIVNDISLIGVGQDYYSVFAIGRGDYYSRANGTGDNGLAMAYFLLGVPGLLHLVWLNVTAYRGLRRLRVDDEQFIAWIRFVAALTLGLYIVTMGFSIRYHKLETFSYFLMIFGVVFALVDIQRQKYIRMRQLGLEHDAGVS